MRIRDWSADVCSSDLQALDYPDRRVVDRPDGLAATWALDRALQSQSPIADAEFPPADRAIGLCPDAVQIIGHGASIAQPDQRHQRPRPPACGRRERKRKAGGLRDGMVAGGESRGGPSWRSRTE